MAEFAISTSKPTSVAQLAAYLFGVKEIGTGESEFSKRINIRDFAQVYDTPEKRRKLIQWVEQKKTIMGSDGVGMTYTTSNRQPAYFMIDMELKGDDGSILNKFEEFLSEYLEFEGKVRANDEDGTQEILSIDRQMDESIQAE